MFRRWKDPNDDGGCRRVWVRCTQIGSVRSLDKVMTSWTPLQTLDVKRGSMVRVLMPGSKHDFRLGDPGRNPLSFPLWKKIGNFSFFYRD